MNQKMLFSLKSSIPIFIFIILNVSLLNEIPPRVPSNMPTVCTHCPRIYAFVTLPSPKRVPFDSLLDLIIA